MQDCETCLKLRAWKQLHAAMRAHCGAHCRTFAHRHAPMLATMHAWACVSCRRSGVARLCSCHGSRGRS
eukprot:347241-Chlamydomonas_euryale.AAC.12